MYDKDYLGVVEQDPDGAAEYDPVEGDMLGISAPAGGDYEEPEDEEEDDAGYGDDPDGTDGMDEEGGGTDNPGARETGEEEKDAGNEEADEQEPAAPETGPDEEAGAADGEDGAGETVPEGPKQLSLTEFSYLSRKIRELESTIRTVALSIEESADTVERINKGMKQVLDSVGEAGHVMDEKIADFQNGTETWGADMNRVAGNVRKACEDSRELGDGLKRDLKKAQEEIIRSTVDSVKTETTTMLSNTREDYEELLDQVVANYKQFCKASSQHQKELKKGYFDEVKQLRRILYGVMAAQFVVFAMLAVGLMFRR